MALVNLKFKGNDLVMMWGNIYNFCIFASSRKANIKNVQYVSLYCTYRKETEIYSGAIEMADGLLLLISSLHSDELCYMWTVFLF